MSANPQSLTTARAQLTPEDIERLTGSNAMSPNVIPLDQIEAAYQRLGRSMPGVGQSAPAPNLGGAPAPGQPMQPGPAPTPLQPLMPGSGPTQTQFGPTPGGAPGGGVNPNQLNYFDILLNNDRNYLAGTGIDPGALGNLMRSMGRDPSASPEARRPNLDRGSLQGALAAARQALGLSDQPIGGQVAGVGAAAPGPRPMSNSLSGLGQGTGGVQGVSGAPSGVSGRAGASVVPALGNPDGAGGPGQGGLRGLLERFGGGGGPMSRFGSTFMGASPFPFAGMMRGGFGGGMGMGMGNPFAAMLGSGLFGMGGMMPGMGGLPMEGPIGPAVQPPYMPQMDPTALLAESLFGGGLNVG